MGELAFRWYWLGERETRIEMRVDYVVVIPGKVATANRALNVVVLVRLLRWLDRVRVRVWMGEDRVAIGKEASTFSD